MVRGYTDALRNKMLRETELFLGRRLCYRGQVAELPGEITKQRRMRKRSENARLCLDEQPFAVVVAAGF